METNYSKSFFFIQTCAIFHSSNDVKFTIFLLFSRLNNQKSTFRGKIACMETGKSGLLKNGRGIYCSPVELRFAKFPHQILSNRVEEKMEQFYALSIEDFKRKTT